MSRTATITKRYTFEAAHHLPYHEGQCRRPHGHSYQVEVVLSGVVHDEPETSEHGMVLDFGRVSTLVKDLVIGRLDHHDLNIATGLYTTAENLAYWIFATLDDPLSVLGVTLQGIRLWETSAGSALVTRADYDATS